MAMGIAQRSAGVYRKRLLPLLRGAVTPFFRFAVRAAIRTGILPRAAVFASGGAQRFLIVHLSNHVGDTVMLLPMLEALRRAHPDARVECVVQAPMDALLAGVPGIDKVYGLKLGQGPTATPGQEIRRAFAIIQQYRGTMQDASPTTCIVPRWSIVFRDLMLAYLTQAPCRIGFATDDFAGANASQYRDGLLTLALRGGTGMIDPEKYIYLVQQAGLIPKTDAAQLCSKPSVSLGAIAGTVDWERLAARLGIPPRSQFAVIAPGASASRRIWPSDRWLAVMDHLQQQGLSVVLLTGPQDAEFARRIHQSTSAVHRSRTWLADGITTLQESTCLLAHACLFFGNDSGPGHLAGALGIPSVILFIAPRGADPNGPSAPERIRPMGTDVLCCRPAHTIPPCTGYCTANAAHCIREISVAEVVRAGDVLMDSRHEAAIRGL